MKIQKVDKTTGGTDDFITSKDVKNCVFLPAFREGAEKASGLVVVVNTIPDWDENFRLTFSLSELRRLLIAIESDKRFEKAKVKIRIIRGRS